MLRSKYQLNILGSIPGMLSRELELALLDWLWNRPDGIGYLCIPLNRTPLLASQAHSTAGWLPWKCCPAYFPDWVSFVQGSIEITMGASKRTRISGTSGRGRVRCPIPPYRIAEGAGTRL